MASFSLFLLPCMLVYLFQSGVSSSSSLYFLAIGDWGATTFKEGSCCMRYRKTGRNNTEYFKDFWAQNNVADLMDVRMRQLPQKPLAILNHGDNFYWNGVVIKDRDARFEMTFEKVYHHDTFKGIPWISVMGNHDLVGGDYICGDIVQRKCKDTEEMLYYLNLKFELQRSYTSPYANRWKLLGHYYKWTIKNNDITIDVFNVDTNYADSHGARQICCQCYGKEVESKSNINCNDVSRGHPYCANGDVVMYDVCVNEIKKWWDESMEKFAIDSKNSKADYKIVNSHYSPHFHMSPDRMKQWNDILAANDVRVWFNGHTHGENHDYGSWGTHFFENGAGGGIQSETSGSPPGYARNIENIWIGHGAPYGFFDVEATKEYLKVRFNTFDDHWLFTERLQHVKPGGVKMGHCWIVPRKQGKGYPCP